jgi:hypothetical protein
LLQDAGAQQTTSEDRDSREKIFLSAPGELEWVALISEK